MSSFFQNTDTTDIEAIRNSFGEQYVFLEKVSIETNSAQLKDYVLATFNEISSAYCEVLRIQTIPDLRELVAYTDSTFDITSRVQDPHFALIMFGLGLETTSEELSIRYEKVKSELEKQLSEFELESSKTPIANELKTVESAFEKGMKFLVHDTVNRMIEPSTPVTINSTTKRTTKGVFALILLVVLTATVIIYFKK